MSVLLKHCDVCHHFGSQNHKMESSSRMEAQAVREFGAQWRQHHQIFEYEGSWGVEFRCNACFQHRGCTVQLTQASLLDHLRSRKHLNAVICPSAELSTRSPSMFHEFPSCSWPVSQALAGSSLPQPDMLPPEPPRPPLPHAPLSLSPMKAVDRELEHQFQEHGADVMAHVDMLTQELRNVIVKCRQSEASAEVQVEIARQQALSCEEREREFQSEAHMARACLRNIECEAAESKNQLTEKIRAMDIEILCLQKHLQAAVAAEGTVLGIATTSFDGTAFGDDYLKFQRGDWVVKLPVPGSQAEDWAFGRICQCEDGQRPMEGWFPPAFWKQLTKPS